MAVQYRSAAVAGVNVAYREAGDPASPALLLLHGFPASSFMYRRLLAVLADRFHLVAPDYPGVGTSEAPDPDDWPYTFEHLTDTIEAHVDHLELSRCGLFLQGYGAPVGFWLALRRPEAVAFLVVQNGSAYEEGFTGDEIAGLIRAIHTTRAEPSPTAPDRRRRGLDHPAASLGGRWP